MKFVLTPPVGYRTYRLMLFALIVGGIVGAFGVYRGQDYFGVAAIITSITLVITGGAAVNNIGTRSVNP